jgi:hypothetical protein
MLLALSSWARAQDGALQPAEMARERASEQEQQELTPPASEPLPAAEPSTSTQAPAGAAPQPAAENQAAAAARSVNAASPSASVAAPPRSAGRETSYGARAVVAPAPGTPREEERIGDYAQPRWSATRRFPTTRVYVKPAGQFGVEWWLETKLDLADTRQVRHRSQYELEMGLGHRLQLDLYLQTEQDGHHGPLAIAAEKAELRWALADWGVIPLNPTLYAEFVRQNGAPPKVELKALFGGQLAPRWHAGANVAFEHLLGADQTNEYALTTAISYSLMDSRFSLGGEIVLETVDHSGRRFTFDNWELLAGPSLAWAPVAPMHVLLVALLGNETELQASGSKSHTPLFEPTLVLGWEI